MKNDCDNCKRLERELSRIARANMVTPLAVYHKNTAESIDRGWRKLQARNAELKKTVEKYQAFINIVATQLSPEDYKECGVDVNVVLSELIKEAKQILSKDGGE